MQKYTNQQYKEIFNKLPQEIRDAVSSYDGTEKIWKIGEDHKLQIDQIGVMHQIVLDIIMGIIPTKNFAKVLAEELNISPLEAANLSRDIDENIFKPIKKSMITMYGEGAPNKPSSSLVQFYEEDDEHKELSKESILREIESPAPAIVRKEINLETEKVVESKQENTVPKILEKIKTEIEVYPEEITGKVLEIEKKVTPTPIVQINTSQPKTETPKQPSQEVTIEQSNNLTTSTPQLSPSFSKLADMKLSQAMVMPRIGENNQKPNNPEAEKVTEQENNKEAIKIDIASSFIENKKPTTETPTMSAIPKKESIMPNNTTPPQVPTKTPTSAENYTVDPYRETIS